MENSFQTSFIPKKPVTTTAVVRRPSASIFTILTVILLIVMGIASGGLFVYKNYLIKQKEVLSNSLLKVRDSFEKDTIDELELYDKRVSASKQILNGHIVLSPLFALLGDLTIPEVQYTKFEHDTVDKGFIVKLSGVATDYRSIALQADAFNSSKGRSFKNVVFSNLTKDKMNRVGFDLEFTVDPALLSYEKNSLLESSTPKVQQVQPASNVNQPVSLPQTQSSEMTNQQTPITPTSNQSQ